MIARSKVVMQNSINTEEARQDISSKVILVSLVM